MRKVGNGGSKEGRDMQRTIASKRKEQRKDERRRKVEKKEGRNEKMKGR